MKRLLLLLIVVSSCLLKVSLVQCNQLHYNGSRQTEYALMPPIFQMDDFEQCMELKSKALYCYVTIKLEPIYPKNASNLWKIIEKFSAVPRNYRHDKLRRGICLPLTCNNFNITVPNLHRHSQILNRVIERCYDEILKRDELQGFVTDMHCETTRPVHEVDEVDLLVGGCLLILISVVFIATFYEGCAKYKPQEKYDKIFSKLGPKLIACFSLRKNWYRLTSVNKTPEAKSLSAIQGVRFLNTLALIFGHTTMAIFAMPISNTVYVEESTERFVNTLVNNGVLVVQTFIVISGILLSYYFFLTMETCKNVKIGYAFMAIVDRYISGWKTGAFFKYFYFFFCYTLNTITMALNAFYSSTLNILLIARLTPCLLVMIGLQSTWAYHSGRGPIWDSVMGTDYRRCRTNWWTNLLFINNYVNADEPCLQHTWYLAADMQLFVVTLIVLLVLWRYRSYAKLIFGSFIIVAMLVPGVIGYVFDFDIVFRPYPEYVQSYFLNLPQYYHVHISGYNNFASYLIGAAFGYLIYKYRGNTEFSESKRLTVAWWILTWILPLTMILIGAIAYQDWYKHSRIGTAIYASFGKSIFSFGVCVGIFGSTIGFGWYPRWLVQWRVFRVLGRLTYCAYICHLTLIRMRFGNMRSPLYHNDFLVFYQTMADIAVAYMAATVLCLFVELPVSALQKLIMSDFKKVQTSKELGGEGPLEIKQKMPNDRGNVDNIFLTLVTEKAVQKMQVCRL